MLLNTLFLMFSVQHLTPILLIILDNTTLGTTENKLNVYIYFKFFDDHSFVNCPYYRFQYVLCNPFARCIPHES